MVTEFPHPNQYVVRGQMLGIRKHPPREQIVLCIREDLDGCLGKTDNVFHRICLPIFPGEKFLVMG